MKEEAPKRESLAAISLKPAATRKISERSPSMSEGDSSASPFGVPKSSKGAANPFQSKFAGAKPMSDIEMEEARAQAAQQAGGVDTPGEMWRTGRFLTSVVCSDLLVLLFLDCVEWKKKIFEKKEAEIRAKEEARLAAIAAEEARWEGIPAWKRKVLEAKEEEQRKKETPQREKERKAKEREEQLKKMPDWKAQLAKH